MKPSLQLKLSQHLTLTPQLQQSIKLLQLSTLELNQEIERFLLENPMLEREDIDGGDYRAAGSEPPRTDAGEHEGDTSSAPADSTTPESREDSGEATSFEDGSDWTSGTGGSQNRDDEDDSDFQDFQATAASLRDHLDQQVSLAPLSDRDRALVRFIIEALDDDGYLNQSLEELLALLPPELEFDLEDLSIALHQVQSLEPSGIGARSPQECLDLQLKALPPGPVRDLARVVVCEHLELLAERNFARIKRSTGCNQHRLQRRRTARSPCADLHAQPASRFAVLHPGNAIRGARRRGAQTPRPLVGGTECRRDAAPAGQRLVRQHSPAEPRLRRRTDQPAAGSALVDQERATALRHDPAGVASHC